MDDFGMGYALGQDSGSSCRDGGSGMWGGDGSWIFAFLIIALIFGGRGGLFGGGWGGNSGGYGDGINSPFVFPVKHILKDNLFSVSCLPPGLWPIVFPCFYCDYIIAQFIIKYNKISIKFQ